MYAYIYIYICIYVLEPAATPITCLFLIVILVEPVASILKSHSLILVWQVWDNLCSFTALRTRVGQSVNTWPVARDASDGASQDMVVRGNGSVDMMQVHRPEVVTLQSELEPPPPAPLDRRPDSLPLSQKCWWKIDDAVSSLFGGDNKEDVTGQECTVGMPGVDGKQRISMTDHVLQKTDHIHDLQQRAMHLLVRACFSMWKPTL